MDTFQSAAVLGFPCAGLILMCLLFSLLERVPVHWRVMSHWACCDCAKFKYSPYPKYTSSSSAHSSAPAQARSQCHCTLLFALAAEGCAGFCPFFPGWPMNQGWRRKRRRCCGCSAQPFSGWLPLYASGHWQGKVPWGVRSLQAALPGTG